MPPAHGVLYALAGVGQVPDDDGWLGPRERELQRKMKVEKRRGDFRLGRFVAKKLLQQRWTESSLSELEILPDSEGAPRCYKAAESLAVSLSLSHRGEHGLSVMMEGEGMLGCDLELVEARSQNFMRDYFTEKEQAFFASQPELAKALLANVFWSAKESALKALRTGLRRDARELEVTLSTHEVEEGNWAPLRVEDLEQGHEYFGYWQRRQELIMTLASNEPIDPPLRA